MNQELNESVLQFPKSVSGTLFFSQRQTLRDEYFLQWSLMMKFNIYPSTSSCSIHYQSHMFETSHFYAAKSFLVFSQKQKKTIWKQILVVISYSEVESHKDIGSILCISSTTIDVFCKYPMQLHCEQSAGMLSMDMCLITTHSKRERAGGKAKQRYFDIFGVITVLRSWWMCNYFERRSTLYKKMCLWYFNDSMQL